MDELEKIKERLRAKKLKPPREEFLHSGSTLLNLACSDRTEGGYKKGHYYLLAGDTGSGKTVFGLAALAEASINQAFDKYGLYFDNAEDGALMPLEKFYGRRLAERIKPPPRGISTSVEELYYNLDDLAQAGKPFIYFLDSMDAVSSEEEQGKFQEKKKAHGSSKKVSGSYGDGKAKKNSSGLRSVIPAVRETGSLLFVVGQSRANFDPMTYEDTMSGGRALNFYATLKLWFKSAGRLKIRTKGKEFKQGVKSRITIKKNRESGKEWSVDVPIYWSVGIDDLGSMVDFLLEYKFWKQAEKGEKIEAPEFDFTGKRDALVAKIEDEGREQNLKDLTKSLWDEIRTACEVKRRSRYE